MLHKFRTVTLCAVAASTPLVAADTVSISFDGISGNYGRAVDVDLAGGLTFADGDDSKRIWAGQLSHTIDGKSVKTFCTELAQWAHSGIYDVVAVPDAPSSDPMGGSAALAIYRLFNATNGGADIDSNTKAAAFQATIWEIAYDFSLGLSLTSGKVKVSGVSGTWFTTYSQYATDPLGDASPTMIAYTNDRWQDQLGPTMIPLPGAAGMGLAGLAMIAARRRR